MVALSDIGKVKEKGEVTADFRQQLNEVNEKLVAYQKINSIIIVDEDWTIDNNILTPTMKIKRNELNKKYHAQYDEWYEQKENIIWL